MGDAIIDDRACHRVHQITRGIVLQLTEDQRLRRRIFVGQAANQRASVFREKETAAQSDTDPARSSRCLYAAVEVGKREIGELAQDQVAYSDEQCIHLLRIGVAPTLSDEFGNLSDLTSRREHRKVHQTLLKEKLNATLLNLSNRVKRVELLLDSSLLDRPYGQEAHKKQRDQPESQQN